jgi:autotransporter-associated beta strand protein
MQKTPFTLCNHLPTAVVAAVLLAWSSPLHAQSSWDGGSSTSGSWGNATNWVGNVAPTFGTSANLIFNDLTRPDNDIGGARIVQSISYGANMDGDFLSNFRTFNGGAAATLTLQAASGNASITVDSGATGNLNLGYNGIGTAGGALVLGSNLDINHNGSGNLTFSRQITGANGFTKSGTGTMIVTNFNANSFTGAANFNGGRAIFGNTSSAGGDLNTASAVNLGGGTLEIRTAIATNKTLTANTTVSAASTLAYNNTTAGNQALTIQTGSMALNADLTVQNISSNTTLANAIIINRNMTGVGNLIVDTYNNVNSRTANTDLALGRVALGGSNNAWTGNLVISKGTAQLFGDTALGQFNAGSGDIILGETGNSFGAGFVAAASTPTAGAKTLSNDIVVRSGGFRTLRGGSDHSYTFSGSVALEGDLNVHNGLFFTDKTMTLSGNISGVGGLSITESGNPNFTRLSGNNTYAGATTIGAGAVLNIMSASGNAIGDSSAVTFDGAGATLAFNTTSETVGSIASFGNSGAIALGGNLLTTGGNGASTTYGGVITGTNTSGLTKVGAGTMTLSGANTNFLGRTIVNGGTLTVNGSLGGGIDVSSGSLLNGSGTIGGASTVNGTLSAGNSPGQMTFSSDLSLGTGSNLVWELFGNTSSDVSQFDRVNVGGSLLASSGSGITLDFGTTAGGSTVDWSNAFWDTAQTWTFLTVTGTTTGFSNLSLLNTSFLDASGNSLAAARSGSSFSITQSGSDVAISYVPEPSTGSLLLMGLASWALVRATRRTA